MKFRLVALLFFVVAVASVILGQRLFGWMGSMEPVAGPSAITEASTRDETGRSTISYRLDAKRWTTFTFPEAVDALRLLSHADVDHEGGTEVGDTFRYGIEIELLDSSGEVLRSLVRHFRTELVIYTDARDGAQVTARRYSDDAGVPLAVDRLVLEFGDLPGVSHVRLRSHSMDPGLSSLNIRVYRPRPFTQKNTAALWERLALSEKKALSLGYVHEPDDLSVPEREAILSNRWTPFGPIGVEGRDYVSRTLEIYDAPGVRASARSLSGASGVLLEPGRRIGLRLPETTVSLQLFTLPVELAREAGVPEGRWPSGVGLVAQTKPAGAAEPSVRVIALDENGAAEIDGMMAGLIAFGADHPILLRVVARSGNGGFRDLTDDIPRVRYQVARRDAPLSFAVAHVSDAPAPFRFDLRCICDPSTRPEVALRLVDAAERILREENLLLTAGVSPYDRLAADSRIMVTEATRRFLSVSPDVVRLEVHADHPVLVAAFARPIGVPRRYAIPEEYYASESEAMHNQTWFPVDAMRTMAASAEEHWVEQPTRLAESQDTISPEALAWEQFVPEGEWVAREALVPRPVAAVGALALNQFYTRLPVNGSARVRLAGEGPGEAPSPRLLMLGDVTGGGKVRIEVDAEETWRGLTSFPARIDLPEFAPGEHAIRVEAPEGTEALLSNVAGPGEGYLLRRLMRIRPGKVVFRVPKLSEGREVLSLGIMSADLVEGRGNLEASLDFQRPQNRLLRDWTVERRRFDVRFDPDPEGGFLLPSSLALGAERRMFFVLGADLPVGTYALSVTSEIDDEVLLILSRSRLPDGHRLSITQEEIE